MGDDFSESNHATDPIKRRRVIGTLQKKRDMLYWNF